MMMLNWLKEDYAPNKMELKWFYFGYEDDETQ